MIEKKKNPRKLKYTKLQRSIQDLVESIDRNYLFRNISRQSRQSAFVSVKAIEYKVNRIGYLILPLQQFLT